MASPEPTNILRDGTQMKNKFVLRIKPNPEQIVRLKQLQANFAQLCNALVPIVIEHRCWSRVGLHHLAYRTLRESFPNMGSQMACNAIYMVSRVGKKVYATSGRQSGSTDNSNQPLPVIRFGPNSPVFFDRNTLSLKGQVLSMFTPDGRIRFEVKVEGDLEKRFANDKVKEIGLLSVKDQFYLVFLFGPDDEVQIDTPEFVSFAPAGLPIATQSQ